MPGQSLEAGTSPRTHACARLLRRWGVGPAMGGAALLYAVAASYVSRLFPSHCLMPASWARVRTWTASLLLVSGGALYLVSLRAFRDGVRRGGLVRTGPYARVRHPLYAAWVWFLLPGIALCTGSWLFLGMPVIAGIALMGLIRIEEKDMQSRFGEAYRRYREDVGALLPRRPKRKEK